MTVLICNPLRDQQNPMILSNLKMNLSRITRHSAYMSQHAHPPLSKIYKLDQRVLADTLTFKNCDDNDNADSDRTQE